MVTFEELDAADPKTNPASLTWAKLEREDYPEYLRLLQVKSLTLQIAEWERQVTVLEEKIGDATAKRDSLL